MWLNGNLSPAEDEPRDFEACCDTDGVDLDVASEADRSRTTPGNESSRQAGRISGWQTPVDHCWR